MEEKKQKRKERRSETAAKNKELRQIKKKAEKLKQDKKEIWARLVELNNNFVKMKEQKKLNKKKKLFFPYVIIFICL